jgi:hypothetical protein
MVFASVLSLSEGVWVLVSGIRAYSEFFASGITNYYFDLLQTFCG